MKSPLRQRAEAESADRDQFPGPIQRDPAEERSGEFYLSLFLADRTGELDAKMWDNVSDVLDEFERDDFVKVKGMIQIFHNRPQLTIHKVRRMDESEVEFADYFPSSKRDPGEMWLELRGHRRGHPQSAPEGAAGSDAGR